MIRSEVQSAQLAIGAVQTDSVPTQNSANHMTSGAIYNTLKVSNLGFVDDEPTSESDNLVKSGGVRKQTAPLYCVNDILDLVMIQFREFEYPQISGGKVNLVSSQNLSTLVLDTTKLTSLIVKDAPYNNPYHGITLTDNENNIIKYGNTSVNFTTEDFVGTTKAFIVFRTRNASSYLPTKVLANGYPVTINAFNDAFDLALDKKGFNWINSEKFLNPINDAFKIWEKNYPYNDSGKVNPMPHASINSYRIDLSIAPINSIVASGLNYNGDNYYALTLTDADSNILSHISSEEVSITDFGEARYCWLAGKQNIINIIINGYPYTNYSFTSAVNRTTMLTGKMMWTLCDSLGINTWQSYFKNITGINFRNDLNTKRDFALSVGGTGSWPKDQDGTQARALRLASYKNIYPIDYIFIENVNDGRVLVDSSGNPRPYAIGTKDDKPFMLSKYKTISPQSFASNAEARTWIENNWSTFLGYFSASEKKAGVIARIPITPDQSNPNGSKITFSGTVVNNGQISFAWEGYTYAITAEVGDSPQNIVDKFLNYQFGAGSVDVDGGNGSLVIFDDYTGGTSRISNYNGGNTGITATIVDAAGVSDYCWTFYGDTELEFDDISNWNNADSVTIWSVYKGLISYMQRTFPESNIYWLIPFSLNPGPATNNPYKDANGNYDMNLYKDYPGYKNRITLFSIQREVCEYLGIPVIDLFTKSGMGISNIETYIPYNDVHPNSKGYKRYAEYMAKLMGIG